MCLALFFFLMEKSQEDKGNKAHEHTPSAQSAAVNSDSSGFWQASNVVTAAAGLASAGQSDNANIIEKPKRYGGLCRIGLHRFGPWEAKMVDLLNIGYAVTKQIAQCERCGWRKKRSL